MSHLRCGARPARAADALVVGLGLGPPFGPLLAPLLALLRLGRRVTTAVPNEGEPMTTIHKPSCRLLGTVLLAGFTTACGSDARSTPRAAAQTTTSEVLDACTVIPPEAFASLLGGPVRTMGTVNEMGTGWFSNCWFSGEQRVWLTLNAMFQPSRSSTELVESMGSWMDEMAETLGDDDVDPEASGTLVMAEGFAEPAARHYDNLMGMHVVTVQHGAYWVQVAAADLDMAMEATRIALEHAP